MDTLIKLFVIPILFGFATLVLSTPLFAKLPKVMWEVKRVGIEVPEHNVAEFKKKYHNPKDFKGILSSPVNHREFSIEINKIINKIVEANGRFYGVSVLDVDTRTFLKGKSHRFNSIFAKFRLDAWLKPRIKFHEDYCIISLNLLGYSRRTLIREDIILSAWPTREEVVEGFSKAIIRIEGLLAHLGKVQYRSGQMYVVDVGSEMGLTPGTVLQGGVIFLGKTHPITGEFLRTYRAPFVQFVVQEVSSGYSLAKLTHTNVEVYTGVKRQLGRKKVDLLVWREDAAVDIKPWVSAKDSLDSFALSGGTQLSDVYPNIDSESYQKNEGNDDFVNAVEHSSDKRDDGVDVKPSHPEKEVASPESDQGTQESVGSEESADKTEPEVVRERVAPRGVHSRLVFGLGTDVGLLTVNRGDEEVVRHSGMPVTLLNSFSFLGKFPVEDTVSAEFGAGFQYFDGGDISDGSAARFGLAALNADSSAGLSMEYGLGLSYALGEVSTTLGQKELTHFNVEALFRTKLEIPESERPIKFKFALSLNRLLKGELGLQLGALWAPMSVPEELSFGLLLSYEPDWFVWGVHAMWSLPFNFEI